MIGWWSSIIGFLRVLWEIFCVVCGEAFVGSAMESYTEDCAEERRGSERSFEEAAPLR